MLKIIKEFNKKKTIVIGDIMVDRYIYGKVNRISPEAPVPVVNVEREVYSPGGAANVARNLSTLGAKCYLFGVVGKDLRGERLIATLKNENISTSGIIVDPTRQTTLKTRIIAHSQQVVRVDQENTHPISEDIVEKLIIQVKQTLKECDAIIISDYGKGVITKKLFENIINYSRKIGKIVTVDPKIEHFKNYRTVTCITPNLMEATLGMGKTVTPKTTTEIINLGKEIVKKLKCESVLITLGENGMVLVKKSGEFVKIETKAKEVYDVTGAGDTVIAVFTLALASGATYELAARISNIAAGIVVGKLGTATVTVDELKKAISQ